MNRTELTSNLYRHRLVAVVRSKTAEAALEVANAAGEAGIRFIEITFSVPGALDVIKELAARKNLHVGAGTVLASQQAERAIGAGAEFIVSPSLEVNLVGICHAVNVACFPGAATATEIIAAHRARADLVKIFPADLVGGAYFIRQMQGPFPEIRFMVSGGVSLKNVSEYVEIGVAGICLGSSYLAELLAKAGKKAFVREVRKFVSIVENTQLQETNHRRRDS
jgi:2-dehydro-3-deoxyphosphogluconate aldolase/(4S)-4-hydroxy-2-oxoglutarate aldolase